MDIRKFILPRKIANSKKGKLFIDLELVVTEEFKDFVEFLNENREFYERIVIKVDGKDAIQIK